MDKVEWNERKLIEMLKSGDKKAISILYDAYAAALYGVIFRIVKSHADAESILERTFLKCLDDVQNLDNQTTLFSHMFRIARAMALGQITSGVVISPEMEGSHELPQSDTADYPVFTEGLDSQRSEILRRLCMQGHSIVQTAQALNIPVEKVKEQLRCALIQINTNMGKNPKIALRIMVIISLSCQYWKL